MFYIYILIVITVVAGLGIKKKETMTESNLTFDDTSALKGLAAMLVLLHHLGQASLLSETFAKINYSFGWVAVGIFFFLSFYGLTKGWLKDREGYAKKIFTKKIPRIYIEIVIINIISFALFYRNAELSSFESAIRILQLYVFFGFDMITGYSWFITSILILYALFGTALLCKRFFEKRLCLLPIITLVVAVIFVVILELLNAEWWHYRAILCVPLGVTYAVFENKSNAFSQSRVRYYSSLVAAAGLIVLNWFFEIPLPLLSREYMNALLACVILVILLQKVDFGKNKLFVFLGKISLEIYLLQFIILSFTFNIISERSFPILFACVTANIGAAYLFNVSYSFIKERTVKLFVRQFKRGRMTKTL
ncbi:MAG: acyltransferase family protein [Christensenellaceae bacterium]|nr:acyltransferase family protein [Christensenellaceae bacterium]